MTITATVAPQGAGTPTGTVTFYLAPGLANELAQVALAANGQAQFTTSWYAGNPVYAAYSGDSNFSESAGYIIQVVNPPSSISVTPASAELILGGNSQQYSATGYYSSGPSVNITSAVNWSSSNPSVATISSTGLATTGSTAGNTSITAFYDVASSPAALGVVQPGASVLFLGGGSSAMFLELGQAAQSSAITATPCVWTQGRSGTIFVSDRRPFLDSLPTADDYGNIWITWSPGSGTCAAPTGNFNIYSYMSLDSVVGMRCYFEVDLSGVSGCEQNLGGVTAGTAGQNLLCVGAALCAYGPDTPIPQAVISALNLRHWFAASTDILPADAKFVTYRMLQACGQTVWRQAFDQGLRENYGLGYEGAAEGIGVPVDSYFSENSFNTLDFNFSGSDPITGTAVPAYSVNTIGVKPIIVAVSPAGDTSLGAAADIPAFTLALLTDGSAGRSTDLLGPTETYQVTTLINEPLSGAYNVMEYSISNSSQFHTSQDASNCSGSGVYSNPMNLQSANGQIPAYRVRAVGTSEMISQLQAGTTSSPRLGYFFWSAPNASTFTETNGKYLTVNGVDPLLNAYTDGVLPGVDVAHPLSSVTFNSLNAGDYPIWSVMRIVSQSQEPLGVFDLILAAQGLNLTQYNFISPANLQVWHSHYYLPAIDLGVSANGATINTPYDLCTFTVPETGGDAGGANTSKQLNYDFCADFGNGNGLINKTN